MMRPESEFIALSVMFHDSGGGVAGSVSFKLPSGEVLNIAKHVLSAPPRRIISGSEGHWWLDLAEVCSHRARLPSGAVVTEVDHAPHCEIIDGETCLRLDDFVSGKVNFERFTLLYRFTEIDIVAHPCIVLPFEGETG